MEQNPFFGFTDHYSLITHYLRMKLSLRPYQSDTDYWRIRQFLREVFLRNERQERCWQVYRFDYWRWHGVENLGEGPLEEKVFLWETPDSRIAAVLNAETPGHAYLQVDPTHRSPALLEEMLATAEAHLSAARPEGRKLFLWVQVQDAELRGLMARRGFAERTDAGETMRWRSLADPIPDRPLPEGYTIRSLGGPEEVPARSWASWRGFHPDDPDEDYTGWAWYLNVQRAPLYRRDLDLVAVAPDGSIASFCTIWFDDVTRTGAFEPVATVPEHLRRGLSSGVMYEGMRRLQRLGATLATVGSYSEPAHSLYASVGFSQFLLATPWEKRL